MRLGHTNAEARGLNLVPAFFGLIVLGLWLVSSAIASVGIISFIGLIAPNIARFAGARTPKSELWVSMVLGACLLLFTDTLTIAINYVSISVIPSGTTTALIGAPVLVWFARSKLKAHDQMSLSLPNSTARYRPKTLYSAVFSTGLLVILGAFSITLATPLVGYGKYPPNLFGASNIQECSPPLAQDLG